MNRINFNSQLKFVDEAVARRAEPHPLINELRYDSSVIASMLRLAMTNRAASPGYTVLWCSVLVHPEL